MWKKVVKIENYIDPHANGTRGRNILTLECGHCKAQNGSIRIPKRCNCKECDDAASGRAITYFQAKAD